jgi:ATP-binding protein involved in chromosome partitioning
MLHMPSNELQRKQMQAEREQIAQNLKRIKHQILVLSGKGGVGKSSIAVNLAIWLTRLGKKVGLLDVDIHGPSIPKLLNLEGRRLQGKGHRIEPILYNDALKVVSIGFLIQEENAALIWRGPMKHSIIKQFISDVWWGDLDYLIIDCPPGTGDEPLSIIQLLGKADGAIVVTTPQQLAIIDVKKCITFCRQLNLTVLGIIENMSGFVCPHCKNQTDIFKGSGGKKMAGEFNIPFLGSIPIDPDMVTAADLGKPFISYNSQSPASKALCHAFESISKSDEQIKTNNKEQNKMRVAIPLTNGKLSQHFGHCEQFVIIDADIDTKNIESRELVEPPAHEPGILPRWLSGLYVNLVIAGGMGQRAQQLFAQHQIEVVVGAPAESAEDAVSAYLCDH